MTGATKRRLLILTTTFPRWPQDHDPPFVLELARRLTDSFEVMVIAPHTRGALEDEEMHGVRIHRFRYAPERLELLAYDGGIPSKLRRRPWLFLLVPGFLLVNLLAAYRLLRRIKPQVVHAHWLVPGGLVGSLLQELPAAPFRLVVTAHGADVHLGGGRLGSWLKREVLRSADLVTVVSSALRDTLLERLPSAHFAVAPMGVDLVERFTPMSGPAEAPTLVFAGRLVEKKGVADLLRAMPTILKHVPEARLLVAGNGPLAAELLALVRELALDSAVEFLGSVPNDALPDILRLARLAVFPFRVAEDGDQEGLGLVMVEAMGCGIPVIAADLPAVRDVVTHDHNGWLVPSGDPQAFADAVVQLLTDTRRRARLAAQARRDALDRFDWSVVAEHYRQLLGADSEIG